MPAGSQIYRWAVIWLACSDDNDQSKSGVRQNTLEYRYSNVSIFRIPLFLLDIEANLELNLRQRWEAVLG